VQPIKKRSSTPKRIIGPGAPRLDPILDESKRMIRVRRQLPFIAYCTRQEKRDNTPGSMQEAGPRHDAQELGIVVEDPVYRLRTGVGIQRIKDRRLKDPTRS